MRGEQPAERAPGLGVRRRQVDGDLQISNRVVDPLGRFESLRLRRQPPGRRGRGRGPVLERAGPLVERDRVEQIEHALALRARQRRRIGPDERLQPRPRRGRSPDRPLEPRQAEQQVEAPLAVVLQRVEPLVEEGDNRVTPLPARRILRQQVGQVHVGVVAVRVLFNRAAQDRLGLGAPARAPEREPQIGRQRRVSRIARGGPGEELRRLGVASGAQPRHRLRVLAARRRPRAGRRQGGSRRGRNPRGGRLGRGGAAPPSAAPSASTAAVATAPSAAITRALRADRAAAGRAG